MKEVGVKSPLGFTSPSTGLEGQRAGEARLINIKALTPEFISYLCMKARHITRVRNHIPHTHAQNISFLTNRKTGTSIYTILVCPLKALFTFSTHILLHFNFEMNQIHSS